MRPQLALRAPAPRLRRRRSLNVDTLATPRTLPADRYPVGPLTPAGVATRHLLVQPPPVEAGERLATGSAAAEARAEETDGHDRLSATLQPRLPARVRSAVLASRDDALSATAPAGTLGHAARVGARSAAGRGASAHPSRTRLSRRNSLLSVAEQDGVPVQWPAPMEALRAETKAALDRECVPPRVRVRPCVCGSRAARVARRAHALARRRLWDRSASRG